MSKNEKKVMALMALASNFGKEFPECLLPIWLDLLEPYRADHVSAAVRLVIQRFEYKTLPPFAVLQKALDQIQGMDEDGEKVRASAEWTQLLEMLEKRGLYHGKPDDLSSETEFALRCLGGWDVACLWKDGELAFRRREFLELWKNAHERGELIALMPSMNAALTAKPLELGI